MHTICWFRRVLRLDDHPALVAAAQEGPVIPLVILDPEEACLRPASALRQALALPPLDKALRALGSRLIVRRGTPETVLAALVREVGPCAVHTTFGFPFAADDTVQGVVEDVGGRLVLHRNGDLVERGVLRTGAGQGYKVYTPFLKALRAHGTSRPLSAPVMDAPEHWPASDGLDWPEARRAMDRGWDVVASYVRAGEDAARSRVVDFLHRPVDAYAEQRNEPFRADATSGLSDALAVGEISARRVLDCTRSALYEGRAGADVFVSELVWREFARDLLWHNPTLGVRCWRAEWEAFPWQGDGVQAQRWQRGETGIALVDAGQRELYATGRMHNRVRMVSASYLTKHLLTDWRVGLAWFERCLTDWDPASNAMNWQWVAGCGPDASPYFRIFNPDGQADRYDPQGVYRTLWLDDEGSGALAFARAAPRSWSVDVGVRPEPIEPLAAGRLRALDAYGALQAKPAQANVGLV